MFHSTVGGNKNLMIFPAKKAVDECSPPPNATFLAIWREMINQQKIFPPLETQLFN